MSHKRDQKLVDRFVQGLATRTEEREVETRLREEARFRHLLQKTMGVVEGIKSMPELEPPLELVAAAETRLLNAKPSRRLVLWVLIPAVAASVAAIVLLVGRPWSPSRSEPALLAQMSAISLTGRAWIERGGTESPLRTGEVAQAGQRFATGESGSVTFRLHGRGTLVLPERSQLGIIDSGPDRLAVAAGHGALRVVIEGQKLPPLEIHLEDMGRWIEIREGSLGLLRQDADTAVVACESGAVTLKNGTRPIALRAGYEVVIEGSTVGRPRKTPAELVLRAETSQKAAGGRVLTVSGQTNPGAEVWINGRKAAIDSDGNFSVAIQLIEEKHSVVVAARDALLRRKRTELAVGTPSPSRPSQPVHGPLRGPTGTEWEWERSEPG